MRRLGPWLAVLFFAVLAALEITHGVTRLGAIRRARAQEIVDGAAQAQSDLAAELRAQGTEGRRHAGYVARLPAVGALLRGGAEASRPMLSGQVLAQLASFPEIDRVRVLSDDGREVFRCERMGGGAAAIPEPLLAREPDLAALELAAKLEPGGVAISGLFLDRERVEVPESERKVIHHVAKPPEPGLRGCVVVTMYASPILDRVRTFVPVEGSRSMLVTRSGDYVASPDRAQEIGAPTASNLAANHPEAAPVLRGANRVQTDDGVFLAASAGELPWLVVTAIPDAALTAATRRLSQESGLVIAGMIATLVLILIAAIVFHRLALRAFRVREAEAALRQLEEKREMERRLATAERLSSLGLLTAGVAHEINNPLEGIGNYLTLLDDEKVAPDKRRRYVASVRHGFERIREVVRNLLGFARPVRGAGSADLRRVIAHAAELARFSKEGRDVTLEAPPGDAPGHGRRRRGRARAGASQPLLECRARHGRAREDHGEHRTIGRRSRGAGRRRGARDSAREPRPDLRSVLHDGRRLRARPLGVVRHRAGARGIARRGEPPGRRGPIHAAASGGGEPGARAGPAERAS